MRRPCARCGKPRRGAGYYCLRCSRARRVETAPVTGADILALRIAAGMIPQTQLADELGVSPVTIARWETSAQGISRRMQYALRAWARRRHLTIGGAG